MNRNEAAEALATCSPEMLRAVCRLLEGGDPDVISRVKIRSLRDVQHAVMDVIEGAVIAGLAPDDINREIVDLV